MSADELLALNNVCIDTYFFKSFVGLKNLSLSVSGIYLFSGVAAVVVGAFGLAAADDPFSRKLALPLGHYRALVFLTVAFVIDYDPVPHPAQLVSQRGV